jgi:hypothetical protein
MGARYRSVARDQPASRPPGARTVRWLRSARRAGVSAAAHLAVGMDDQREPSPAASRRLLSHGCESQLRAWKDRRCSAGATVIGAGAEMPACMWGSGTLSGAVSVLPRVSEPRGRGTLGDARRDCRSHHGRLSHKGRPLEEFTIPPCASLGRAPVRPSRGDRSPCRTDSTPGEIQPLLSPTTNDHPAGFVATASARSESRPPGPSSLVCPAIGRESQDGVLAISPDRSTPAPPLSATVPLSLVRVATADVTRDRCHGSSNSWQASFDANELRPCLHRRRFARIRGRPRPAHRGPPGLQAAGQERPLALLERRQIGGAPATSPTPARRLRRLPGGRGRLGSVRSSRRRGRRSSRWENRGRSRRAHPPRR